MEERRYIVEFGVVYFIDEPEDTDNPSEEEEE